MIDGDELIDLNRREYVMLLPLALFTLLLGIFPSILLDLFTDSVNDFVNLVNLASAWPHG